MIYLSPLAFVCYHLAVTLEQRADQINACTSTRLGLMGSLRDGESASAGVARARRGFGFLSETSKQAQHPSMAAAGRVW